MQCYTTRFPVVCCVGWSLYSFRLDIFVLYIFPETLYIHPTIHKNSRQRLVCRALSPFPISLKLFEKPATTKPLYRLNRTLQTLKSNCTKSLRTQIQKKTKPPTSSARQHTDLIDMAPPTNGYQQQAVAAHNVEGGANMAGNGDDGGGGGGTPSICDVFCAAFCKDNPLAEAFGFNQPPDGNTGNNGPHAGGGGGGYPPGGGFAPASYPPAPNAPGGFGGFGGGPAPDSYNNGVPLQPITTQSKHHHDIPPPPVLLQLPPSPFIPPCNAREWGEQQQRVSRRGKLRCAPSRFVCDFAPELRAA